MMQSIQNSIVMERVIDALFAVVGRRTLGSHALKVIQTVLSKLRPTYSFLNDVIVHDDLLSQDSVRVTIAPAFDTVEPQNVGTAVETLIEVMYLNLVETTSDEVGLYFITELKGHLGDQILDALRDRGVKLEHIQQLQHQQHQNGELQQPEHIVEQEEEPELSYSWETVSSWKYDDNVCMLYNSQGALLDTIQLDLLIEDYVRRVGETRNRDARKPMVQTILQVTAQDDAFLEMLKERDIDVEYAMTLLHISQQKLQTMIQKLLQLEMLQYVSDNEVKLTEKGLHYLRDRDDEPPHRSLNGPLA